VRQQLEDAAIDCRSVTIRGGSDRTEQIKRVAFAVAGQLRRMATIEINGRDLVVSFIVVCRVKQQRAFHPAPTARGHR
jgi:hypothetical protein